MKYSLCNELIYFMQYVIVFLQYCKNYRAEKQMDGCNLQKQLHFRQQRWICNYHLCQCAEFRG